MSASSDRFWQETEAALAAFPVDVRLERDGFYSQPDWDVYQMHYTSADGFRLFSWLSVPEGRGPFPAVVRMPDYGSVHDIVHTSLRRRAVVMNPTFRGSFRGSSSQRSRCAVCVKSVSPRNRIDWNPATRHRAIA